VRDISHIQGVKPDTQRRALVAVLALGGVAIGMDRLVLNSSLSGPETTSASPIEPIAQERLSPLAAPVASTTEPCLAERLDRLRAYVSSERPEEAFAVHHREPSAGNNTTRTREPNVEEFIRLMQPQLRGISGAPGGRRIAVIRYLERDSKGEQVRTVSLELGQTFHDAKLIAIDDHQVAFQYRNHQFTVDLAVQSLKNKNNTLSVKEGEQRPAVELR
jgi:hypothetical protein